MASIDSPNNNRSTKSMVFSVALVWIIAISFMLMLVFSLSCTHKELCFSHMHDCNLRVEFDWSQAEEANPEGMAVFFYPEEGGEPYRYDFSGKKGGEIAIPNGNYHVMTYNNDTPGVMYKGYDSHSAHTLYTREGVASDPSASPSKPSKAPLARGAEDERVVICPDEMFGTSFRDFSVTPETGVITLTPTELTCRYTVEIRNVKNLDIVSKMSGSLSGMAPELTVHGEQLCTSCATLPFEAEIKDPTTITAKFITFGHHEDNPDPHKMMFYVHTTDGKKYAFGSDESKFDVTSQVHSAPDKRRVNIVIDGMEIPHAIEGSSFEPVPDEWEEVNIDIPM